MSHFSPREIVSELDDDAGMAGAAELPPAIDPLERQFLLAQLVLSGGAEFAATADQALRLADSLAGLVDEVHTERVDFTKLEALAPEEFAAHWQNTLAFLRIVTEHWPRILESRGVLDSAARRRAGLEARAAAWRQNPPNGPVIAAGFSNADPALADLIALVAQLPQGLVVLPGLDRGLDNEGWDSVEPTHPQYGLKQIVEKIGVARAEISPWPIAGDVAVADLRAHLLTEALRPAATTEQWREGLAIEPAAIAGMSRLDCGAENEEAEAIALAMRATLETPGRTAALVTPDRGLARRVAASLQRWGIAVDDSAGRPLNETPVGVWLRLVARAVIGGIAPVPLLELLKHPFAACGLRPEILRRHVRALERALLRGPRPKPGLDGLAFTLERATPELFDGGLEEKQAIQAWLGDFARRLAPFDALVARGDGTVGELVLAHGAAAESLAETPEEDGALRLWRGPDGEAAADLLARLAGPATEGFSKIPADRYPALLDGLMAAVPVRPAFGAHPRLAIWGLIEARLQRADLMILGGLNEGSWPPLPADEPWMSRPMRARFGLPPHEARIGGAAHDFVQAASSPELLLTRALRVGGAPTVQARFLSRLEAVLTGAGLSLAHADISPWRHWADGIDKPSALNPGAPPFPCPPLAARPRQLSVTAIETWMRDPYALYARHILTLRALDPIDADPGAAERGNFIHEALDRFLREHPGAFGAEGLAALLVSGRKSFGEALTHPSVAAFWWPRFVRIAGWFLDEFEQPRRRDGVGLLATEVKGRLRLDAPGGPFTLTAKADRIDRLPGGLLAILDYKTGRVPSAAEVEAGLSPQLTLEAAIAEFGTFDGVLPGPVGQLSFLRLSGGDPPGKEQPAVAPNALAEAVRSARLGLERLVVKFDDPATGYPSRPRPAFAYRGDYDHLARTDEWAIGEAAS